MQSKLPLKKKITFYYRREWRLNIDWYCRRSEQINDVIALIKEDGRPLKAIAITHSHDDHLGGLIAFKQAFPDTPFLFPEREYQLILKKELLPSDKQVPLKEGIPNQLPFCSW